MPRQIGWSQESNLLYDILMQLDRLLTVAGGGGGLEIYPTLAAFPPVGDESLIYLAQDTNKIYYWNVGTLAYVEMSPGLTSVGLTMPSAFTVTNSPLTSNGTIAVTGAGIVSQYIRGDGTLSDFPGSTGGGASVNYYINGGTNQGVFGGNTYYEMSKVAVTAAAANFSTAVDGYVAQFITDPADPSLLQIPGGSWNIQFYLNASSAGGTPSFYVELYKYDGAAFTLLGSSSASPEMITGGTSIDLYYTSVSVPTTTLLVTDRLAIRVYVVASGRTITLYTQDNTLGQIQTTFTSGMTALNGLTAQVQYLTTGTAGTDFNITSSGATHTFDLPVASAVNTGKLSASDWSSFNSAVGAAVEVLGAGTLSTVRCGGSNTAAGACAAALAGACNTSPAPFASSTGGFKNTSNGVGSFVGGGFCNIVCNATSSCCAIGSSIVGGIGNSTTGGTWNVATCTFTVAPTLCQMLEGTFIGGGFQNTAFGKNTVIAGGCCNKISCSAYQIGDGAFIGGGFLNTAVGNNAVIVGGSSNKACNSAAVVVGGSLNCVLANESSIVGGAINTISDYSIGSFIAGGYNNTICLSYTSIGGGVYNTTKSALASNGVTIAGGVGNNTTGGTWSGYGFTLAPTLCNAGCLSFIGGGFQNRAAGIFSSVVAGCNNLALGQGSFIGGGCNNYTCHQETTIAGGSNNCIFGATTAITSAINGGTFNCISGGGNNSIAGGFCNSIIGSTSAVGGGAFNAVTGGRAVISGGCCNTAAGQMSSVGGGFKNSTQAVAGRVGGGICNIVCNSTSGCLALGAVVVGGVGNNTTGGTWDLATCSFTVAPTICNAGQYSFIGGGFQNLVCACYGTIAGGFRNIAGQNSFVGGGCFNRAEATSFIGSGCCQDVCGQYGAIGGGGFNCLGVSSNYAAISGGSGNYVNANWSVVGGGIGNSVNCQRSGIMSGGFNTTSSVDSFIGGGIYNFTCAMASFIGGGNNNAVSNGTLACLSYGAVVAGGVGNNTTGGTWNLGTCAFTVAPTICNAGQYSFVGGGFQNQATGCFSGILGGQCNVASGAYSGAFGCNLTASVACTFYTNNQCVCGTAKFAGQVEVNTTTGALLQPRLTTAQRNALTPVAGMTIFNTDTAALEVYNGAAWQNPVAYANTAANLFNYYNFV